MRKVMMCGMALLLQSYVVTAQNDFSINDYLESYVGENAVSYVQPVVDIYTAGINTGVWEWASIPDKLYLSIKAEGMVAFPTESMRTFVGKTSGDFRPQQTAIVPTIIGDKTSVVVYGEDKSIYVFPGGLDLDRLVSGTPQLTIGGFLNSEISVRYFTFTLPNDPGMVHFYGLGGRHSLSNYITDSPVDFSVGYMYQHMTAGSYIQTEQHLISGIVGKASEYFSGHIMIGYQASITDFHYTYDDGDAQYNVDLNVENSNPWIMEGGIGLQLKPLRIFGTISYAGHTTIAAGFGLSF